MKAWERDLLDHLVLLVAANADPPKTDAEILDDLKREFRWLPSDERRLTPQR